MPHIEKLVDGPVAHVWMVLTQSDLDRLQMALDDSREDSYVLFALQQDSDRSITMRLSAAHSAVEFDEEAMVGEAVPRMYRDRPLLDPDRDESGDGEPFFGGLSLGKRRNGFPDSIWPPADDVIQRQHRPEDSLEPGPVTDYGWGDREDGGW